MCTGYFHHISFNCRRYQQRRIKTREFQIIQIQILKSASFNLNASTGPFRETSIWIADDVLQSRNHTNFIALSTCTLSMINDWAKRNQKTFVQYMIRNNPHPTNFIWRTSWYFLHIVQPLSEISHLSRTFFHSYMKRTDRNSTGLKRGRPQQQVQHTPTAVSTAIVLTR